MGIGNEMVCCPSVVNHHQTHGVIQSRRTAVSTGEYADVSKYRRACGSCSRLSAPWVSRDRRTDICARFPAKPKESTPDVRFEHHHVTYSMLWKQIPPCLNFQSIFYLRKSQPLHTLIAHDAYSACDFLIVLEEDKVFSSIGAKTRGGWIQ